MAGNAVVTALTDEERIVLRQALRFPRGRYEARRAAQLSGIPECTVYDWAREGVLVPDFCKASPKRWSYRDLVYLRLPARLRAAGMPREQTAERVGLVRRLAAAGDELDSVRFTDRSLLLPGEDYDRLTDGPRLAELTGHFDLLAPIAGARAEQLWGVQPRQADRSDVHLAVGPRRRAVHRGHTHRHRLGPCSDPAPRHERRSGRPAVPAAQRATRRGRGRPGG